MKSKKYNNKNGVNNTFKAIITGVIVGFCIVLVIAVATALIASVGIVPLKAASLISSFAIAVGGFFGGFITAKILGKNGLLFGMLSGFILFLVFSVISLIAFSSTPTLNTLIRLIIFVSASGIGGIIGVGSAGKTKIV